MLPSGPPIHPWPSIKLSKPGAVLFKAYDTSMSFRLGAGGGGSFLMALASFKLMCFLQPPTICECVATICSIISTKGSQKGMGTFLFLFFPDPPFSARFSSRHAWGRRHVRSGGRRSCRCWKSCGPGLEPGSRIRKAEDS